MQTGSHFTSGSYVIPTSIMMLFHTHTGHDFVKEEDIFISEQPKPKMAAKEIP